MRILPPWTMLVAYLTVLIGATLVHDVRVLAGLGLAVLVAAGRHAPRLARRALWTTLLFNGVVSVSWVVWTAWHGDLDAWTVLRINVRVFVLTTATLTWATHTDVLALVQPFRTLRFLVVLVLAQVQSLRRTRREFSDGLRSRTLGRLRRRDLLQHAAATTAALLERSESDAREVALALRSRGFFDDPT